MEALRPVRMVGASPLGGRATGGSGMGQHAAGRRTIRRVWLVSGVAVLASGLVAGVVASLSDSPRHRAVNGSPVTPAVDCSHPLTVVSATSFAPVLRRVATLLHTGPECVALDIRTADGQAGAVAAAHADVWIPDDTSWPNLPSPARLAPLGTFHAGMVLATSPFYFVTQRAAPPRTWLGLIRALAQRGAKWHLVLRDPATTGDGMVPAGALTDVELGPDGVLVAALNLLRTWQTGVTTGEFPTRRDQVGVVPEYALLRSGKPGGYTVVAPSDGTALLNFTWLPSAAAVSDPAKAQPLSRLYDALTGPVADDLAAAGLRGPAWSVPVPGSKLPPVTATPIPAVSEHVMYHVLATWHPELRRSNMLIVLDVSGSMGRPGPGTTTPKIALVRQGITQVAALLPDSAQLGLWQFGSLLAPPYDWQSLVSPVPLGAGQRRAIAVVAAHLRARATGTGLYDTILAAYRYQSAHYRADMPNEVVIFTDGINQDDPVTISLSQLHAGLAATDPHKRVQLSVFGIGNALPAAALNSAVTAVGGQVDLLATPDQVIGAFVHAVSGALSGVPG
jgi:Ca-activated chloride channel homolog